MLSPVLGTSRLLFSPLGFGEIRQGSETAIVYDPSGLYVDQNARYFHSEFGQTWMACEVYAQTFGGA